MHGSTESILYISMVLRRHSKNINAFVLEAQLEVERRQRLVHLDWKLQKKSPRGALIMK